MDTNNETTGEEIQTPYRNWISPPSLLSNISSSERELLEQVLAPDTAGEATLINADGIIPGSRTPTTSIGDFARKPERQRKRRAMLWHQYFFFWHYIRRRTKRKPNGNELVVHVAPPRKYQK